MVLVFVLVVVEFVDVNPAVAAIVAMMVTNKKSRFMLPLIVINIKNRMSI